LASPSTFLTFTGPEFFSTQLIRGFIWFLEQTGIIPINNNDPLILAMESQCNFLKGGHKLLNNI
jgi:hypothetical protein